MALGLSVVIAATAAACGAGERKECRGELADIGPGCRPTFDVASDDLPLCDGYPRWSYTIAALSCGDLVYVGNYLSLSGGGGCYYDAVTHQLVGASSGSDVAQFCGNTSNTIVAGKVSRDCAADPIATRDCHPPPAPDAATDAISVP